MDTPSKLEDLSNTNGKALDESKGRAKEISSECFLSAYNEA